MFEIGEILSGTPEEIWQKTSETSGIDHDSYLRYYEKQPKAFAFAIRNVRRLGDGNTITSILGDEIKPHSFVLLSPEQAEAVHKCIVFTKG